MAFVIHTLPAPPEDLDYATRAELYFREREVRSQKWLAWMEFAKFAALLAVPVGAIVGIGPFTRAIKKALAG